MNDDVKEFLERLDRRLDKMEEDVKDLLAWKNKLMGIFIGVSVITTFLINELKSHLGIV